MDKRRKTLAGLSPSQLNTRASLAPGRVTKDGKGITKLSLLGSRASLIGAKSQVNNAPSRLGLPAGPGPRRSSTYGKNSSGVKPDPRPVNDKAFQANCVRCLIGFLSTHGYDQPISPKLLASPMSKDFTSIVQFLIRQVDPHLNPKAFGKIEDDVPTFFKRLRYPFQISKSSLFAVGSPHTWPTLLASLVWITELLCYAEKAERTKAELVDEKQRAESDFFEYVSESYRCFLAGDDYQCEQVDNAKTAEFDLRAEEIRSHNKQVQEENEGLKSQVEALRSAPSPLLAAKARKEEHNCDREKFKKLIENLQSQKQALQLKLKERKADLASKVEQLAQAEQERNELAERVSAQTFNREDIVRMNDERMKRQDILQSAEAARDGVQRRVRDQEVGVEQRLDELDMGLQDYNTTADRLQLIPVTAKRAGGIQFEVKLNRTGGTASEMINVDFKGAVKAALGRLREASTARSRQLVEEALALQERLDALTHGLTERTEENATLTTQVHKLDKQLIHSKEEHEADIRGIQAQAEQIKAEVSEMKNATSHSIAHSSGRVQVLQSQFEEVAQACEVERSMFNQDMAAALHAVFEHKEQITNKLHRVHGRVLSITNEMLAIRV